MCGILLVKDTYICGVSLGVCMCVCFTVVDPHSVVHMTCQVG